MYLLGKTFQMETDHKLLVPLLSPKSLDTLPPRVLRFRLRLIRYNFTIVYTPGAHLCIPDALSRAPLSCSDDTTGLQVSAEAFISNVVSTLPATQNHIEWLRKAQEQDKTLTQVIHYCVGGGKEGLGD